jgi:hypothetical protein
MLEYSDKQDWDSGFNDGKHGKPQNNNIPAYVHGYNYGVKVKLYSYDQQSVGWKAFKESHEQ